jgi:hypothetical protein
VSDKNKNLDKYLFPILLFLICFALYEPRAAFTPQESDGGEFATAAVTGSVVHEPGYPVYMAMARTIIEIFDPADPYYALSLFSCFCQAGAVALLFLILKRFNVSSGISFLAALAWGMYGPVFRLATDTEVFAFHHLLIGLSLYVGLAMRTRLGALAYGLCLGLAAAHHQTIILWAPIFIYLGFSKFSGVARWPAFGAAMIGLLAGFSSYITLMTAHIGKPILAFTPPQSLAQLYSYIMRDSYGSLSLTAGIEGESVSYIWHFVESAVLNTPFAYFGLIAPFVFFIGHRNWHSAAWMLAAILHWVFLAMIVLPNDFIRTGEAASRFYGLVSFAGVVMAGYAVGSQKISALTEAILGFIILISFIIVFPGALQYADSRRDVVYDYEARQILSEITPAGIFIAQSDRSGMATVYQHFVFNNRPDVTIVIRGLISNPSYRKALSARDSFFENLPASPDDFLRELYGRASNAGRKVFTEVKGSAPDGFIALPVGVAWQIVKKSEAPALSEVTKRILAFCANWPENLSTPVRTRKATRSLLGDIFIWPLTSHAPMVDNSEITYRLIEARDAFIIGDLKSAKEYCRQGYMLLVPDAPQPIQMPLPY